MEQQSKAFSDLHGTPTLIAADHAARFASGILPIAYAHTQWHTLTVNKTIYIRDEDIAVWDRARELAGDKLAPVIIDGLKRFILEKEREEVLAKGYERIAVSFNDADQHGIPKVKAFLGKWIFPPEDPIQSTGNNGLMCAYTIAITAKGAAVIYWWQLRTLSKGYKSFDVFPSLQDAAAESEFNYAATQAIKKLGIVVEELDI
jgi:hypothetical protein